MLPQRGKKKANVCVKGVKLCNEQCFKKVKSIVAQLFIFLKGKFCFITAKYFYAHKGSQIRRKKANTLRIIK